MRAAALTLGAFVLLSLALILGATALQIGLSKKESKWPGLVLPIIAFVLSLGYPLNMASAAGGVNAWTVLGLLRAWLVGNIPTLLLLTIYFGCRKKQSRKQ